MDDLKWLDDFLDESIPLWKVNPVLFCHEVLLFYPDKWQQDVLVDLVTYPKISVKSGQGVGKTGIEACAVLWFLVCYPFARIVATAPTRQQLNDVLWSEISKWMNNSPLLSLLLKWTKTYIYMLDYEKRWFAVARTATKPENMQGFHEDNMLFVVDEASGVADPIMEAINGTLSGANNKLLLMGNPTRTSGTFYDSHMSDRALYRCYTVSSRNSPRTNKDNITSLERKYGKKSNVVRVRVDGEFPLQEDDVFIPLSWIEASVKFTEVSKNTEEGVVETIDIGCDVARFGDDKTCIGYKINEKAFIYMKYNGQDTTRTKNQIAMLFRMFVEKQKFKEKIMVKVDDGGVGGGVVDQLRELKRENPAEYKQMEIFPVNFGQPIKHKYYYDSTTYMMSVVRDMIQPFDNDGKDKAVELILPNDSDLIAQLSCRKYDFMKNKQKVESKKEMKERGLPSPDEADCILLTCLPVRIKKGDGKK